MPLLSRCEGMDDIVPRKADLSVPDVLFDHLVPLLSLPHIFGTSMETIPVGVPYIHVAGDTTKKWKAVTTEHRGNETLIIGIAWSGNKRYGGDSARYIALSRIYSLFLTPGTCFYSLQYGEAVEEAKELPPRDNLIFVTDEIKDFTNTAGLMKNLDLVITIDSVIAHLAGSLGVAVWNLLPYVSDWRWLLDREDSPWYPTMRLFRQPSIDDWQGVLERVHAALAELRDSRAQQSGS